MKLSIKDFFSWAKPQFSEEILNGNHSFFVQWNLSKLDQAPCYVCFTQTFVWFEHWVEVDNVIVHVNASLYIGGTVSDVWNLAASKSKVCSNTYYWKNYLLLWSMYVSWKYVSIYQRQLRFLLTGIYALVIETPSICGLF